MHQILQCVLTNKNNLTTEILRIENYRHVKNETRQPFCNRLPPVRSLLFYHAISVFAWFIPPIQNSGLPGDLVLVMTVIAAIVIVMFLLFLIFFAMMLLFVPCQDNESQLACRNYWQGLPTATF